MVVPIRELANKYISTTTFISIPTQIAIKPAYETMGVDQNNIIRERSTSPSNVSFRRNSISSRASSVPYHKKMEINNNLLDEEFTEPIDSSQLSYNDSNGQGNFMSKATDNNTITRKQHGTNEALALKKASKL